MIFSGGSYESAQLLQNYQHDVTLAPKDDNLRKTRKALAENKGHINVVQLNFRQHILFSLLDMAKGEYFLGRHLVHAFRSLGGF